MDDHEYELKQVELTLKEREVAAREREVTAKEKEGNTSKLFNPLTIAIYVAAFGLFANMYTARKNNEATATAEHVRAQSNLLSSVIRTNGNTVDSCSNLIFVVSIKLLDDPDGSIQRVCGTKGGVPTLPALGAAAIEGGVGAVGGYGSGITANMWIGTITLTVRVEDADSNEPIPKAKVDVERLQSASTQGLPSVGLPSLESKVVQSTVTDAKGEAILNVSSLDSIVVGSDG